MKNADKPAMPYIVPNDVNTEPYEGLSKREMMAMHMMAALLSSPAGKFPEQTSVYKIIDDAVNMADAMLSKLDRSQGESK